MIAGNPTVTLSNKRDGNIEGMQNQAVFSVISGEVTFKKNGVKIVEEGEDEDRMHVV